MWWAFCSHKMNYRRWSPWGNSAGKGVCDTRLATWVLAPKFVKIWKKGFDSAVALLPPQIPHGTCATHTSTCVVFYPPFHAHKHTQILIMMNTLFLIKELYRMNKNQVQLYENAAVKPLSLCSSKDQEAGSWHSDRQNYWPYPLIQSRTISRISDMEFSSHQVN